MKKVQPCASAMGKSAGTVQEGRMADRKGRGEASFKLLRPPQREGTNLRKFLPPPLTRPQIACILCIMNNVHVEVIR